VTRIFCCRLEQKADELEDNYRIAASTESDLQYRLEKAEEENVMLQRYSLLIAYYPLLMETRHASK
jgi:hypothetical protein